MSVDDSFRDAGGRLLEAVIPTSIQGSLTVVEPLPMVGLGNLPRESSLEHQIAAVDGRGRVSGKHLVELLGWRASEPVSIELTETSVAVVRRCGECRCKLTAESYLRLPVVVRRRLGISAGDRVFLAAAPAYDLLVVHHMSALDEMVLAYHSPSSEEG